MVIYVRIPPKLLEEASCYLIAHAENGLKGNFEVFQIKWNKLTLFLYCQNSFINQMEGSFCHKCLIRKLVDHSDIYLVYTFPGKIQI